MAPDGGYSAVSSFDHGSMNPDNAPAMEPQGICHQCKQRTRPFPPQCRAFPKGIPTEILVGDFVHTSPYPGDNGIQFERKGGLEVAVQV